MSYRPAPPRKPEDDGLDEAMIAVLSAHLAPGEPVPEATRARLMQRILAGIAAPPTEHRYYPARDGDWRVLADRVYLKVLERDAATGQATYLVRYSPGTSFPRHPQKTVEECLLVAGDLRIGDIAMRPGDLQIAVPGIEHGPLISEHGALVFVRGVLGRVPETLAGAAIDLPGGDGAR